VLRFIVRRLIQMVGVVIVLSLLLFIWLRSLPGGTVSAMLGDRATPESTARLTKELGLEAGRSGWPPRSRRAPRR
jgi:peptide/nickel transport system permease protein